VANFSVTSPADENNGIRYMFTQWSGDYSGTSPSASVTMNQPKEVVAGWKTQYYLTVTSSHDNPQGEGWYDSGVVANFSVTSPADEGEGTRYVFTQWSGDYSGTSPSGSVTMSSAREVIANWKTQYYLTTSENPPEGGDITPSPPGAWYDNGTWVNISASTSDDYEWNGWTGDLSGTTNPTQILMDGPKSVTANFRSNEETISKPDKPEGPSSGIIGQTLTYSTGGASSSLGHEVEYKFDWGDGSQSEWGSATRDHEYSNKGTYTIKARARCKIHTNIVSNWSNGKSVSITAYSLTVHVDPSEAGDVDRNPNKNDYSYRESVRLTAVPENSSYQFDHWSGDLSGSTNPDNIVMNENKEVTAHFEIETVSVPNKPTGPDEVVAGDEHQFRTGGASSSFGHSVEYQFDFGDGNLSNWGSSSVLYTYSNIGTYSVKARARCANHHEIVSDWSNGLSVTVSGLKLTILVNPDSSGSVNISPEKDEYNYQEIVQLRAIPADRSYQFDYWSGDIDSSTNNPRGIFMRRDRVITANFRSEVVSVPDIPLGPSNGSTDETITFSTGGSVSSFDHEVEYQFSWGDGALSEWGSDVQSHIYHISGIREVKARARCTDHPRVVSDWSEAHSIQISEFTLTINIDPSGTGQVVKTPDKPKYAFGETVELFAVGEQGFYFVEGSGDVSGTENPVVLTIDNSKVVTAHFEETEEVIAKPTFIQGPDEGKMGQKLSFLTGGAESNLGNPIEYQYDWGDSTFSDWGGENRTHVYFMSGEIEIRTRARSKTNISVVSEWSDVKIVMISGHKLVTSIEPENTGQILISPDLSEYPDSTNVQLIAMPAPGFVFSHWSGDLLGNDNPVTFIITEDKNIIAHFIQGEETITTPQVPIGLDSAYIGQHVVFTTDGAVSNLGNEVEYQFNWGDGTLSQWGDKTKGHVYFTLYTFEVRARARSKANLSHVSSWSQPHYIKVSGLSLNVSVSPEEGGYVAKSPQKQRYAYMDTVKLWTMGANGYHFDYWSGDLTGDGDPGIIVMNGDKDVIAHFVENEESVSKPVLIVGPQRGYRKQSLSFTAGGSRSSKGNAVDYQYDWGDGQTSEWGDSTQSHIYTTSGNYLIRARARSQKDHDAVSDWTNDYQVQITGCKLIVQIIPENSGDVSRCPNLVDYDYGAEVVLNAIDNSNYVFVHWGDSPADTMKSKAITLVSDTTIAANFEYLLSVEEVSQQVPSQYELKQNYPNPFNPETRIEYQLPENCQVKIIVYNLCGQIVNVLVDDLKSAG